MAQNKFTLDHFRLLKKWKGQKRDKSMPEQNQAYEELANAYQITEDWANGVRQALFAAGSKIEIRKRPTNQADNFSSYTWAKIYPRQDSPKELAYTVGIDADIGFIVKIDTVGLDATDQVQKKYLALRGQNDGQSPIVAILDIEDGLQKSLSELITWSVVKIQSFKMNYDTVAEQVGLIEQLDDSSILKHFDGNAAFRNFRASWTPEVSNKFCRIARIVHIAGLDWWHIGKGIQVRFGRKSIDSIRAAGVLGVLRGKTVRKISLLDAIGSLSKLHREPLNEELVKQLEEAFSTHADFFQTWLPADSDRRGYWPDELADEDGDDDSDMEDLEIIKSPVRPAFNRIYYGPPGTGKTYQLQQLLDENYTQQAATLSPVELTEQKIAQFTQDLTWWEVLAAALYNLGGTADVSALMQHPYVQAVIAAKQRTTHVRQTIWGSLQQHAPEESKTVKTKGRIAPYIFDKSENSVWRFVGDWKDQCAELIAKVDAIKAGSIGASEKICRYEFVTFHQSFGYEEFVEGLRPVLAEPGDEAGDVKYHIPGGAFLRLCEKARKNPTYHYAMVIDEINRGNVSKIFGELITLIEIDKREGAKYPASVTLPYSGNPFNVPANVDVIGTMNTADRSLALVDTALRRRFDFVEVMPDARDVVGAPLYELSVEDAGLSINIPKLLSVLNKRIEALYDRDHTIGHAYFTQLKDVPDTERFAALHAIFKNKIIPLLEEYFFEDWQKIRLVLGDNQKSDEQLQFIQEINQEDDLLALFGQKHELDQYAIRPRYQFNSPALSQAKAYLGIYSSDVDIDAVAAE